jgi:hypothetical protein
MDGRVSDSRSARGRRLGSGESALERPRLLLASEAAVRVRVLILMLLLPLECCAEPRLCRLDGARTVMEKHGGNMPRTAEGLLDIDGM